VQGGGPEVVCTAVCTAGLVWPTCLMQPSSSMQDGRSTGLATSAVSKQSHTLRATMAITQVETMQLSWCVPRFSSQLCHVGAMHCIHCKAANLQDRLASYATMPMPPPDLTICSYQNYVWPVTSSPDRQASADPIVWIRGASPCHPQHLRHVGAQPVDKTAD